MKQLRRYISRNLHYLIPLPILLVALFVWAREPAFLVQLRLHVFDEYLRLKPRVYEPVPVRVVDIDDDSLERFGQWPWPRTLLAKLVNRLDELGAAAVAFDILFLDPDRSTPSRVIDGVEEIGPNDPLVERFKQLPDHDLVFADAIKQALQSRPELAEAALSLEVNKLDARLSVEQARPRVDAFANLSAAGLAGQALPTASNPLAPFFPPGTVFITPLLVGGYGTSLSNLASGYFPTAQVGLQVSLPLRNRTAEAQEAISAAEGRRLRTVQDQVGMAVEADVRNAVQGVQSARSRLDAAMLASRSAEEQYASEQRQFQAGTSTVFLVLQRQTDFISARSREVRARADLGEAVANLERATAATLEAHGIQLAEH